MKKYYTTHLVKSEDLNHHGTLFAARMASWFVDAAFARAAECMKTCDQVFCPLQSFGAMNEKNRALRELARSLGKMT